MDRARYMDQPWDAELLPVIGHAYRTGGSEISCRQDFWHFRTARAHYLRMPNALCA